MKESRRTVKVNIESDKAVADSYNINCSGFCVTAPWKGIVAANQGTDC